MQIPVRMRAVLICACLLLLSSLPVLTQATTVLTNPGFDDPFVSINAEESVAEGWTAWSLEENTLAFREAPRDRVQDGQAQQFGAFLAPHTGGLYQTVQGVESGVAAVFTADIYTWSTRDTSDMNVSVDPANITLQLGIDPAGGTDPLAESIIWSSPTAPTLDAYETYSVEGTTGGETLTVFIRAETTDARLETQYYVDNASLTLGEGAPASTEDVVAEPTTEGATEVAVVPTEESATTGETEASDAQLTETAIAQQPTDDALIAAATNGAMTLEAIQQTPEATDESATAAEDTPAITIMTTTPEPTEGDAVTVTEEPTDEPATEEATEEATDEPTDEPATDEATEAPTAEPTAEPTEDAEAVAAQATGTAEALGTISDQFPEQVIHTVTYGDTVSELAKRYGSTVNAITVANGLVNNSVILLGQRLVIPVREGQGQPATDPSQPTAQPTQPPNTEIYVVQYGDSLTTIAAKYQTNAIALARLNGITNINRLLVGQRIYVPTSASPAPAPTTAPEPTPSSTNSGETYTVQPGDSLFTIAIKFNTTIAQLVELNDIANPNRILVGQKLVLP